MTQAILPSTVAGWRIAVIGAGCAGLTAAHILRDAGASVTLFDKSRGVGGRMATRRIGERRFDHGAQYVTARGEAFRALIGSLCERGAAAPWEAVWGTGDGMRIAAESIDAPRFAGIGGMTALPRAMAQGFDVILEAEIADLSRPDRQWTLETRNGGRHVGFDAVILAVPAPQAVPLLTGITEFAIDVAAATYAPCWATMVEFAQRPDIPFDAIKLNDAILAWVARDAGKPGRDAAPETWVLHGAADWSLAYLEEPPEVIPAELLERFSTLFGTTATAISATAHRWRYAQVRESAGVPFFWDPAVRVGACGDWCLGARVEAAFDSGLALAHHLVAG
jgi:predicted NAD/FAD-dependent oxidoreductase